MNNDIIMERARTSDQVCNFCCDENAGTLVAGIDAYICQGCAVLCVGASQDINRKPPTIDTWQRTKVEKDALRHAKWLMDKHVCCDAPNKLLDYIFTAMIRTYWVGFRDAEIRGGKDEPR